MFSKSRTPGRGSQPEERERVFERFYRPAQSQAGGSGLGLSIVREIAALYGATVSILDPPQGQGAIVRVSFPSAPKPSPCEERGGGGCLMRYWRIPWNTASATRA